MPNSRLLAFCLGGAAALTSATAVAEPGFFQMDRQDQYSRFGGEAAYIKLDDAFDATSLRFDVHGQYIVNGGFGFYGAFPLAYASGDGDSGTGVGNLEVGGIFLPRMSSPDFQLVLHGGVTLPTANGDDDFEDAIAAAFGVSARPTDVVQIIPEGFTLRLGVSPIFKSGNLFGKLDGGIDLNLAAAGPDNADPLIRVNLGGGIDLGSAAIVGELINLITTDGDADDQMVNALAIGVRGAAGNLRPYGGFTIGLDNDDFAADFAITLGLEGMVGAPR